MAQPSRMEGRRSADEELTDLDHPTKAKRENLGLRRAHRPGSLDV
jgi:hypothetical protein